MNIFQQIFGKTTTVDLKPLIEDGAYLVDVRTAAEFAEGNVRGSVNIPLDGLLSQIKKLQNKKSIIVFCRSGNRSAQAKTILAQNGITDVVNGGTWSNVNQYVD